MISIPSTAASPSRHPRGARGRTRKPEIQLVFSITAIPSRIAPRTSPESSAQEKGVHIEVDDTATVIQGAEHDISRNCGIDHGETNRNEQQQTLAKTGAGEGG